MKPHKDAYAVISSARSLRQVQEVLDAAGYMNDETRRTLMAAVDRSPLPQSSRAEAFASVMGPVSAVQHSHRCSDWWDFLVKSEEMTSVALDQRLPFASLLEGVFARDIMRNALADGFYGSALLLWSRGHSHEERVSALGDMVFIIASNTPSNEESWIAPTVSALHAVPPADQRLLVASLLCEGWFFDKRDVRLGQKWVNAIFPTGLDQEQFKLLLAQVNAQSRGVWEAASHVEALLSHLVPEHDQRVLDASTQAPAAPSPPRRI